MGYRYTLVPAKTRLNRYLHTLIHTPRYIHTHHTYTTSRHGMDIAYMLNTSLASDTLVSAKTGLDRCARAGSAIGSIWCYRHTHYLLPILSRVRRRRARAGTPCSATRLFRPRPGLAGALAHMSVCVCYHCHHGCVFGRYIVRPVLAPNTWCCGGREADLPVTSTWKSHRTSRWTVDGFITLLGACLVVAGRRTYRSPPRGSRSPTPTTP